MSDNKQLTVVQKALVAFAEWVLPRSALKNFYNWRGSEPNYFANTLDVDRLRQIFGEAETGNVRDLYALYRDVIIADSHVQAEFNKRLLAVLGDVLSIQPFDKNDDDDVAASDFIKEQIQDFPDFTLKCGFLLHGTLYPNAMMEKVFRPSAKEGVRYELWMMNPVPYNDISYELTGRLMLRKLDQHSGWVTGQYEEPDPNRYIIHKSHFLSHADYWGGPMRSIMFWWLLRSMDRDWWARFLERYGSPFLVGKYDQADDQARATLTQAFNWATKIFGLVISRETEVEVVECGTAQSGEAFERFHDRCNDEISKLIVGQTGSSNMKSTGLGSGVSKQHEQVRQDIRQFDAKMLGETLRTQLFRQLLDVNGLTGRAPRAVWGGLSPEAQESLASSIASMSQAGYELTDEGVETVNEQLGIPFQRKAVPAPLPGMPGGGDPGNPGGMPPGFPEPELLPLAARANVADQGQLSVDRVAAEGAADLSRAFRGSLAPVRRIILESSSADECVERLKAFYAEWDPARVAALCEEALTAFAANGAAVRAR
jgi:phage gp29-like protein